MRQPEHGRIDHPGQYADHEEEAEQARHDGPYGPGDNNAIEKRARRVRAATPPMWCE
jgi:hypothetical protein